MQWSWNATTKKRIAVLGVTVCVYLIFRFVLPLVIPIVIAGIVAVIYYPILRKVYNRLCKEKTSVNPSNYDRGDWKRNFFLAFGVIAFYVIAIFVLVLIVRGIYMQGKNIFLNYPFYQMKFAELFQGCCCQIDGIFHMKKGTSYMRVGTLFRNQYEYANNNIFSKVTGYSVQIAGSVFSILFGTVITILITFFMMQEYETIRMAMKQSDIGRSACRVIGQCKDALKAYVKAQGLIMLLDGIVCTISFWLVGQPYYLILGIGTAILDALPLFGIGSILLPYAIYFLIKRQIAYALLLLGTYCICVFIRQYTEPKIVGVEVGLRPLYTIASMYVGFRLFGFWGFLLGPVGVLIVKEILKL